MRRAASRLKHKTKNYFRRRAQERLLRTLPRRPICAEIGVWEGELSEMFLRVARPARLHLVDPWEYAPSFGRSLYGGVIAKSQEDMDAIAERVRDRFAPHPEVEIHRLASIPAADLFPDNYFDCVYIDANHLYEFVKADLESFYPKVKPGGLIAGDDYRNPGWWQDGVTRAVDEFVTSRGLTLERGYVQFAIRKPANDSSRTP